MPIRRRCHKMASNMNDELTGKVALVSGSSRGLGRAIALALAREGVDIVVNYRSRQKEAEQVAQAVTEMGRKAVAVQADVSVAADIRRLVDAANERLGPPSILVNNAGIARVQTIEQTTEQDWDDLIDTNLKSCFLLTQAAVPAMRKAGWGRIVNLSSVAAHVGGIVGPHYAASKAGMLGLTHFFASALVKEGITANAISPALVETDMVTANLNATPARIPVGRFGRPEEVAEIVVTLVRNGYITRQTIHPNGGLYMT